jgi:hypothetical protein
MELIYAMGDLGVATLDAADAGDERIRATLAREIERTERVASSGSRFALARRRLHSGLLGSRRRAAVFTAVAALLTTTGVAAAAGVAPWTLLSSGSAGRLFTDNPAQSWPQASGMAPVASSITDLGTVSVPDVGAFQYWGAQTQNGQRCMAFRAPDGLWAGTAADASGQSKSTYNFTGNVPGCGVYSNVSQGGGFHWSMNEIGPTITGNLTATISHLSAVIYGTIDNPAGATTVIDATTGVSAPLLHGHYFAVVEPRTGLGDVQLRAVNSAGKVTARATIATP